MPVSCTLPVFLSVMRACFINIRTADYRRVSRRQQNSFRIVGGRHRSRRLHFPDIPGLRPSPDRVRETVFNWLAPLLPGARVLDLFAGSGAFGLEALSRGAAEAVFVEKAAPAAQAITQSLEILGESAVVHTGDAIAWLDAGPPTPFDIIFVDPPYRAGLMSPTIERLARGWLAPGSRIYLECGRDQSLPELPADWEILKEKTAGEVHYSLVGIR
jgi:16S rRNA (guanine966-N2)-methyltransferase